MCDEVTLTFSKLYDCAAVVWEWINNFISRVTGNLSDVHIINGLFVVREVWASFLISNKFYINILGFFMLHNTSWHIESRFVEWQPLNLNLSSCLFD